MAALPEWAKPIESTNSVPEWAEPVAQQPVASPQQNTTPHPLVASLSNRVDKTVGMADRNYSEPSDLFWNVPKMVALGSGQVAGAGLDTIGYAAGEIVGAVVPDKLKEYGREKIENFAKTEIGQKAISALQSGQEKWDAFSTEHPDEAMGLETIFNLSAFGVAKRGAAVVEREIFDTASDVASATLKSTPGQLDNAIKREVRRGMQKGARPGVEGKRTFAQSEKYFKNAETAVKSIIENKENLKFIDDIGEVVSGRAPQSLTEFSQAISQTKNAVYNQYDELAKATTGDVIDTTPIVNELKKIASNKTTSVSSPGAAKHASALAKRLEDAGPLSASDAQEIIKNFNSILGAYYQNPSRASAVKNAVDALVANNLRKSLDDAIESATGAQYQSLKNQYGALKAIERDVNRRMIVDGRKEVKGLLDFSDIFAGSEAIRAIINKSPSGFAGAAATKGIAKYYQKLKDPNRAIQQMFDNVEGLQGKKGFTPKSTIGKAANTAKKEYDNLKAAKAAPPPNPLRDYTP